MFDLTQYINGDALPPPPSLSLLPVAGVRRLAARQWRGGGGGVCGGVGGMYGREWHALIYAETFGPVNFC